MQNSLERIFDGLRHTLREVVAPAIADPYVAAQVNAAAEIIGNLATRVEWSCAQLGETSARIRPLLERAAMAMPGRLPLTMQVLAQTEPAADGSNESLLAARAAHLLALREVQRCLATHPDHEVQAAIRDFLGWQVAHEASLLRTGMFSAPKK